MKSSWKEVRGITERVLDDLDTDMPPYIVLGNKSDLEDERKILREEVESACEEMGCLFNECSAKADTEITESFISLIRTILKKRYPRGSSQGGGKKFCTIL